MGNPYNIAEHTHRFGLWIVARASSRSLLSNNEIQKLLDSIKLRDEVEKLKQNPCLTDIDYMNWLTQKCNEIIEIFKGIQLETKKSKRMSFGLAAKIISIYIKTVEVLPSCGN